MKPLYKQILITTLVALVVGAAGFFVGMRYQQSRRLNQFAFGPNGTQNRQFNPGDRQQFRGMGNGSMMGMRPVTGEITAMDDKSVTVKLPDGSSKIVIVSDTTTINKSTAGTKSDLKVGEQIMVIGNDSNGTVTAQTINVGGMFMRGINTPTPTK